jgi:UPF0755 protein
VKRILFLLFTIGLLSIGVMYYLIAISPAFKGDEPIEIKIRKGDAWSSVRSQITSSNKFKHPSLLEPVVKMLKYDKLIKPGRYVLEPDMSILKIIRKLRSGDQTPVKLTLSNITFLHQLAGRVSKQIDIDSTALANTLTDETIARSFGLNKENFGVMFLCNTYSMFWNTDIEAFLERMNTEYKRFWNEKRREKADKLGLSPEEIIILASIVQKETNYPPEYARVSGVYFNRLQKGMPLQADPTVKFALGDMSIRRILKKDLSLDSPYNTYRYKGLPPGPICLPEINVIDAVLNTEKHAYLYFCAKYGTGQHVFATSYNEHLANARAYQQALNADKIFR